MAAPRYSEVRYHCPGNASLLWIKSTLLVGITGGRVPQRGPGSTRHPKNGGGGGYVGKQADAIVAYDRREDTDQTPLDILRTSPESRPASSPTVSWVKRTSRRAVLAEGRHRGRSSASGHSLSTAAAIAAALLAACFGVPFRTPRSASMRRFEEPLTDDQRASLRRVLARSASASVVALGRHISARTQLQWQSVKIRSERTQGVPGRRARLCPGGLVGSCGLSSGFVVVAEFLPTRGKPTALPLRFAYMDGRQDDDGRTLRRAMRDRIGALLRSQYDAVRSAGVPAHLAALVGRFMPPWPAKKSAGGASPEERVDRFMPRYPPAKNSADGAPPEK